MKTYYYWNNNLTGESRLMFQCEAEDILAADKKFLDSTGLNVVKCAHIGCTFSESKS